MGRNGHGPKWLWAEMVMGRNDPESLKRVTLLMSLPAILQYSTVQYNARQYTKP